MVLLLVSGCDKDRKGAEPPRNLMVIALDTLRADHLGCYGYPRPTAPFLDRLAREGFVFENAQAQSTWTAPSLISVMTGLNTDVHQVCDSPNPGRMHRFLTQRESSFDKRAIASSPQLKTNDALP